jgi:WD40 repeat protein
MGRWWVGVLEIEMSSDEEEPKTKAAKKKKTKPPSNDSLPPSSSRPMTTASLIEQCQSYALPPPPETFPIRRSLFADEHWLKSSCYHGYIESTTVGKWLCLTDIQFTNTSLHLLQKTSSSSAPTQRRTKIAPYQCKRLHEEDQDDVTENLQDNEGDAPKPMPKKKTGKKSGHDNTNEEYKSIMQIYEHNQLYLHAGGAVNGVHFSDSFQINSADETCTHYFAVATSGIGWYGDRREAEFSSSSNCLPVPSHLHGMGVGYDYPHEVADCSSSYSLTPNLLQIYSITSSLKNPFRVDRSAASDSEEVAPTILSVRLCYCIGFPSIGPIWDVKWCPEEEHFRSLGGQETILGTIAIVSADGKCRVLVLPTPQTLQESSNSLSLPTSADPTIPVTIRDTPLLLERDLCRWELTLPAECVLSIGWGGGSGGQGRDGISPLLLACGLSTGSIALWDLSLPTLRHGVRARQASLSAPSSASPGDLKAVVALVPLSKFVDLSVRVGNTATSNSRAIICGVRVVSFCPCNGDLIASGGYDGTLKVCLLLSFAPLHVSLSPSLLSLVRSGMWTINSNLCTVATTPPPGSTLSSGTKTVSASSGPLATPLP